MVKSIPPEILESLSASTLDRLQNIRAVYITYSHGDASQIIEAGAVLLGVASVNDDPEESGFRFLLGLPNGVRVTPYLELMFPNAK